MAAINKVSKVWQYFGEKIVFVKENSTGTANLHIHNIKLAKMKWTLMCKYPLDFLMK